MDLLGLASLKEETSALNKTVNKILANISYLLVQSACC
jgi:hypothetical protein